LDRPVAFNSRETQPREAVGSSLFSKRRERERDREREKER
jgi:hypothetical protein